MGDPLLPGTIPGLLRRCSPVRNLRGTRCGIVLSDLGDGALAVEWDPTHDEARVVAWGEPFAERSDLIALDLSDATGRAHAAWWLADREGLSVPAWPSWRKSGHALWALRTPWRYGQTAGAPPIDGMERRYQPDAAPEHAARRWPLLYRTVPALAALDPDDDTRLPDGSRWVDAEALRLVVLHVAGAAA